MVVLLGGAPLPVVGRGLLELDPFERVLGGERRRLALAEGAVIAAGSGQAGVGLAVHAHGVVRRGVGGLGLELHLVGLGGGALVRLGVCWTSSMAWPSLSATTAEMDMAKPMTLYVFWLPFWAVWRYCSCDEG